MNKKKNERRKASVVEEKEKEKKEKSRIRSFASRENLVKLAEADDFPDETISESRDEWSQIRGLNFKESGRPKAKGKKIEGGGGRGEGET